MNERNTHHTRHTRSHILERSGKMQHRTLNGRKAVFTHAPILKPWLDLVGETDEIPVLADNFNSLLRSIVRKPWETERKLGFISQYSYFKLHRS